MERRRGTFNLPKTQSYQTNENYSLQNQHTSERGTRVQSVRTGGPIWNQKLPTAAPKVHVLVVWRCISTQVYVEYDMISMGDIIECRVISLSNKWISNKKNLSPALLGRSIRNNILKMILRNNTLPPFECWHWTQRLCRYYVHIFNISVLLYCENSKIYFDTCG